MEDSVLKLSGKAFDKAFTGHGERTVTPIPGTKAFNQIVEKKNHEVNAVLEALLRPSTTAKGASPPSC